MNGTLRRVALVALVLITAVVTLPAAGAGADEYGNGKLVTVRMIDNAFVPQTLVIDPGTIVRWVNGGRSKHNVVVDAKSAAWSSSKTIKAGQRLRPPVQDARRVRLLVHVPRRAAHSRCTAP